MYKPEEEELVQTTIEDAAAPETVIDEPAPTEDLPAEEAEEEPVEEEKE